MFQGNWKCSTCGGAITELPFQPRSESGLTCRACYAQSKGNAPAPSASPVDDPQLDPNNVAPVVGFGDAPDMPDAPDFDPFAAGSTDAQDAPAPEINEALPEESRPQKQQFTGDWKCSVCGGAITSLPFQPRGDASNLKCLDCFKKG